LYAIHLRWVALVLPGSEVGVKAGKAEETPFSPLAEVLVAPFGNACVKVTTPDPAYVLMVATKGVMPAM
jgi:hypothetical protein